MKKKVIWYEIIKYVTFPFATGQMYLYALRLHLFQSKNHVK